MQSVCSVHSGWLVPPVPPDDEPLEPTAACRSSLIRTLGDAQAVEALASRELTTELVAVPVDAALLAVQVVQKAAASEYCESTRQEGDRREGTHPRARLLPHGDH